MRFAATTIMMMWLPLLFGVTVGYLAPWALARRLVRPGTADQVNRPAA